MGEPGGQKKHTRIYVSRYSNFPDLWFVWKGLEVAPGLLVYDAVEVVRGRGAEDAEDVVQLIQVVLPRENRPKKSSVKVVVICYLNCIIFDKVN